MSKSCIQTDSMSPRLSSKLIQSLRGTLQKIDEDFPSRADERVVTELKRLLLCALRNSNQPGTDKSDSTDEPEGVEFGSIVWVRLRLG